MKPFWCRCIVTLLVLGTPVLSQQKPIPDQAASNVEDPTTTPVKILSHVIVRGASGLPEAHVVVTKQPTSNNDTTKYQANTKEVGLFDITLPGPGQYKFKITH